MIMIMLASGADHRRSATRRGCGPLGGDSHPTGHDIAIVG
jgi:hypothetical protein